ncbi:SPFH domain-containing protein [Streptomyces kunmingensis]|uniref:SPFH domain-containing protein n=1 Tax=Streptomyces kunmingensis TaxID=68225 RepID=A0ABU6CD11_9ACTN|nr:SPFH domain-containing protein [Streptomyces kunmingensis]MEB3962591.1 SPFH domain-containing protein [Streptomyces kunmingensis]
MDEPDAGGGPVPVGESGGSGWRGVGGVSGVLGLRGTRVIRNESTTEIPVHLLFRDDPDPVAVPLRPAVVGTGTGGGRPAPSPHRRTPARSVPVVEPDLGERPGRVLPGALGVFGGALGAAGAAVSLGWAGMLPRIMTEVAGLPGYEGVGLGVRQWAALAGSGALALFGFGGLARGRAGRAWVLTLFGRYRGSVRRSGLLWVNPLLLRRRVDLRLRHWRSEEMPAVDANGVALRVVVLVVWRVRDTARATLGVEDHEEYLRECVEAGLARVLSQLPADAPLATAEGTSAHAGTPTLRNAEAVGDLLTRRLAADVGPVGIEVFSAQPTRIEYAPEVAAVMRRRRVAALDAQHRDSVLTSVVDSVEDTVTRLTTRGLVDLDDYERKALVKDLTVAFYTGRGE